MKKWIIVFALLTLAPAWQGECAKVHTLVILPDGRVMPVGGSEYDNLADYITTEIKGEVEALTMSRGHGRITIIERPAECLNP